jgi:hypothetical protein
MASAVTVILLLIVFILIALLVLGYFKYRDEVNKPIVQSQCPETKSQSILPECPDCNCPECPDCNCPVNDQKLKSAAAEIGYLKMMVKFLGSISRRENAINRAVMRECPTTFSMVPMIQSADQEFQYIKNDIGLDYSMLGYFKEHFTRLSGIPSTSYEQIL